jgi:hypothetical protein
MPTVVVLFKDQTRLINLHQQYKTSMKILRMLYKLLYEFGEEASSIGTILINSDNSMRRCIKIINYPKKYPIKIDSRLLRDQACSLKNSYDHF